MLLLPIIGQKETKTAKLFDLNIYYTLYDKCNFMTVYERSIYVILKLAFKTYAKNQTLLSVNSMQHRNFPLATVTSHNSQSFKRSVQYRCINKWNSLPRDWTWIGLSYIKFKELIFNWIISKRNNDYEYSF